MHAYHINMTHECNIWKKIDIERQDIANVINWIVYYLSRKIDVVVHLFNI